MKLTAPTLPERFFSNSGTVNSQSFDYRIKRQKRKSIAVHVLADASVEVRAPAWVPKRELIDFVERRADWIVEQRRTALQKQALKPVFADGQYHRFLGQPYPLVVALAARANVTMQDGVLLVKVRDVESTDQVEKALDNWYRKQAIGLYEERIFACFDIFPDWFQEKYRIPSITVRKMRRRWGSCSSKGDITLSISLMKMPIECIDYVIVHELCHLYAFNHGKSFYALLARVMPDWKKREALIEALA